MNKVGKLREKRDNEGWARMDLYLPPSAAEKLLKLAGGDKRRRQQALIDLLERAE